MKAFNAQLASSTATFTAEVPEGWPAEQDLPWHSHDSNCRTTSAAQLWQHGTHALFGGPTGLTPNGTGVKARVL